jgi:hypothetical protein
MRLLADLSRLDGCSQPPQIHLGWQICELILLLPRAAMLRCSPISHASSPGRCEDAVAHVPDPLRGAVGDPNANSGKPCFQSAFSPQPPTHIFPPGISKHVFRRHRHQIRDGPLRGRPRGACLPAICRSSRRIEFYIRRGDLYADAARLDRLAQA